MVDRPTWALIEDAVSYLGTVEGFANTIASRRRGSADERLAQQVARDAAASQRRLRMLEREDDPG